MADDDGGLIADLEKLVRRILGLPSGRPMPRIDYLATYDAEVKSISSDGGKVDLEPSAGHVKPISGVEVRLGVPGATAVVEVGAIMKLGWVGGDPAQPYAEPSWRQGATVVKLVLTAQHVYIGDEGSAQALVRKSDFDGHTHSIPPLNAPNGAVTAGPAGTAIANTGGAAAATGTSVLKAT